MLKKIKIKLLYFVMNKAGKNIDLKKLEPKPSLLTKINDFFAKFFVDRNALNRIILGPISAKLLQSGYNLGLFHYLAKTPGATLHEITSHLNITQYSAGILLDGLEALKLVQKTRPAKYYNTLHSMLLVQDFNDKFLSKLMNYMTHIISPAMEALESSIKENKPKGLHRVFGEHAQDYYQELSTNEKYGQYFVPFMSAFSQINIQTVAESPNFSGVNRLLDIGGNIGDMAVSIARYHPTIQVTVFDHIKMAEAANDRFQKENWHHRLNALGGDILVNDFPKGYDGILFSHVIDIFNEDTNKKLFQKAYAALQPNEKIFIYTPIVHGNDDNSFTYKIYNSYFLCLANGQGQFYRPKKIIRWIKETGFHNLKLNYLPCNEILITATKPNA